MFRILVKYKNIPKKMSKEEVEERKRSGRKRGRKRGRTKEEVGEKRRKKISIRRRGKPNIFFGLCYLLHKFPKVIGLILSFLILKVPAFCESIRIRKRPERVSEN